MASHSLSLHSKLDLRRLFALQVGVVVATPAYFRRHYIELELPTQVPLSQRMAAIAVGVGVSFYGSTSTSHGRVWGESQGFNPLQPNMVISISVLSHSG